MRSQIHQKWHDYEFHVLNRLDTPKRGKFYGATDGLLDVDDAFHGIEAGVRSGTPFRKLIGYGFLQALVIQQDAVAALNDVVLEEAWKPTAVGSLRRIRELRNRLSGHPVFADRSGRTTSIIEVREHEIGGSIYGIPDAPFSERFPNERFVDLIAENALHLCPTMERVCAALDDPSGVFSRLRLSAR